MISARLKIKSPDRQASESIVRSVEPDNVNMKGLRIESRSTSESASFTITYEGRIETFISTLDDLLRCIHAANATLGIIRENKAS